MGNLGRTLKNLQSRCGEIVFILMVLIVGGASSPVRGSDDNSYRSVADAYVVGYLAWRPQAGTWMGLHEYDGQVSDYSRQSIELEHARLIHFRKAIGAIDPKTLSAQMSRESREILADIDGDLEGFDVFRSFTYNPMTYAGAVDLTTYAQRDFAPKPQRLKSVIAILNQTPAILIAGRANLEEHLPRTFINTAIDQANGTADFMTDDLVKAFEDVKDDALQADFTKARGAAAQSMKDFAIWLRTEKLPKANDDFAIGRDGYARMLHETELLGQSPEDVLKIAMRELKREQAVFVATAKKIDPSKSPVEVSKEFARDHPTEQSLIPDIIKHLESIQQFAIARDLVTFPSMVPVKVEETPKFERHASFAMIDPPGPFEKSTEAFYYVTPTEPEWDAKRKDEWLSRFNYYATDVTTIHEAYPGHYVQFLHLNASSASRCDKIFGSYAYHEGWAHYCEQMMIDEGYPAGADDLTHAKYRLAQSQDSLLRICRLCVSVQMHCQGMTVEQATKFFMDNAYYGEAPARAEAERGTFDPGYGFYTLGKLQILKLREDFRLQEGKNFSLKRFHDAMLDNGQPPIRLLREILLKDEQTWGATL
jgi:uncharacterized protein (DUF885 family)